jgi:hypothetical protein
MARNLQANLPVDARGARIDILSAFGGKTLTISDAGSVRIALPIGADIIQIYASVAAHIKFGDSTVTVAATDGNHDEFISAGAYVARMVPDVGGAPATHIAGLTDSASPGALKISGLR